MKRKNFVLLFIAAAFMILCFTQCHKERSCGATITCLYHPDPSVVAPVKGVIINIDTLGKHNHEFMNIIETINNGDTLRDTTYFTRPISDTLRHIFPHTAAEGSFHFQLPHPALLALKATWVDTTKEPDVLYVGYTQITLEEGVLDKQDTIWLEPEI